MSGFDNAGMHRPNRNLVQVFAFGRQERIRRARYRHLAASAERMLYTPESEIEPRPGIRRADRLQSIKVPDRALQPYRRRVHGSDRGKFSVRARDRQHGDLSRAFIEHRHMHGVDVTPQAHECPAASRHLFSGKAPAILAHDHARPRTVSLDSIARDYVSHGWHRAYPSSFATFWNQATSGGGR